MRLCRFLMKSAVVIFAIPFAVLAVRFPWLAAVIAFLFAVGRCSNRGRRLTACGTARWAEAEDLERAGMLSSRPGLILGKVVIPRPTFGKALKGLFDRRVSAYDACERLMLSLRKLQPHRSTAQVRLVKAVHTAVFAPTGVGKGVSLVIPFLLNCRESAVVVDFKGENAKLTGDARRAMGQKIAVLDPFRVVSETPDTFNPLDQIRADSPLLIDECRALANALVIRTGEEKDPYWNDSAELWITAMLVAVTLYGKGEDRSLQTVRTLLTNPGKRAAVTQMLCDSPDLDGMVARLGNQLTNYKDKELGSVLSTANRFLNFLDTLAIAASTKASTFDPAELRSGRMTVYLVLPPEHMRAQSALLRVWVGSMLRACVRAGLGEGSRCHFVLDEAASLGKMDVLDDAVDKYRGYGVRLQFYYQSLGQLSRCWGEGGDQALLSNTSQILFGVNDPQTAEYVSNRLGEKTIIVDSGGTNDGRNRGESTGAQPSFSRGSSWGENNNWSQQARKLLKPEEVTSLSPRMAITFTPGLPPICTHLTRYYEEQNRGNGRMAGLMRHAEIWITSLLMLCLSAATAAVLMTTK